jgi:hypothetical protein
MERKEIFETVYASRWEVLWSSLPVNNQNFWQILPFLIICHIGIPIHLIHSAKILMSTLILRVKQQRVGHPASIESISKMGTPTKYRTSTFKATEENSNMKSRYSNVQAKVDNGREKSWRPCVSRVKICNRKLDYSKIQAKVGNGRENSWSPCLSLVKIPNRKLDYSKVHSKIDSKWY